jgi:hypothetical protein
MGVSLEMVVGVVVLTVLGILLTGPGMWSEKWGWRRISRARRGGPAARDEQAPRRR